MKKLIILPISFFFVLPPQLSASEPSQLIFICERFEAGKIDAKSTLEALDLNIDDYSIGINNTARIFCA
tara:strand:- start:3792 stop:3998 length:207 start_codon:yes stop_codon:yes gene_type:complete